MVCQAGPGTKVPEAGLGVNVCQAGPGVQVWRVGQDWGLGQGLGVGQGWGQDLGQGWGQDQGQGWDATFSLGNGWIWSPTTVDSILSASRLATSQMLLG